MSWGLRNRGSSHPLAFFAARHILLLPLLLQYITGTTLSTTEERRQSQTSLGVDQLNSAPGFSVELGPVAVSEQIQGLGLSGSVLLIL